MAAAAAAAQRGGRPSSVDMGRASGQPGPHRAGCLGQLAGGGRLCGRGFRQCACGQQAAAPVSGRAWGTAPGALPGACGAASDTAYAPNGIARNMTGVNVWREASGLGARRACSRWCGCGKVCSRLPPGVTPGARGALTVVQPRQSRLEVDYQTPHPHAPTYNMAFIVDRRAGEQRPREKRPQSTP